MALEVLVLGVAGLDRADPTCSEKPVPEYLQILGLCCRVLLLRLVTQGCVTFRD